MKICRKSCTQIRCGCAGNVSGPTFWLMTGKDVNAVYTEEFLEQNGAAKFSMIIMTPTGFLTDEAWQQMEPNLTSGIRHAVRIAANRLGIDSATADRLLVGLGFDGFKVHVKNFVELVNLAAKLILAMVENRDSSEINQAFDRFVARAGKKRAAECLDQIRRAHISPIIDQWMLVLVGLAMLRDCNSSRVWENSFIAVNMHPHHRVPFPEWINKIAPFVDAAKKFEREIIDEFVLLPSDWRIQSLSNREKWIKIIDDDGASWDVNLIAKLRDTGMSLPLLTNMYKIYRATKAIHLKKALMQLHGMPGTPTPASTPAVDTPPVIVANKNKMMYHQFNPKVPGMTNLQRFHHAVTVRNRLLGPEGTKPSPYLDVAITPDNKLMLNLQPDDINMYHVLQDSTCRPNGKRRRVARRSLNMLGGVSGVARFVNDPAEVEKIRENLKFAASVEEIKHAEFTRKYNKAKTARDKHYAAAYRKLGLPPDHRVLKKHASKLTIPQMKAVAFVDCGETLRGTAAKVREDLMDLLPASREPEPEPVVPEYATQDAEADIVIDVPLEDMVVDDCVEVYWKGDGKWYEGRILSVDLEQRQFAIKYFLDNDELMHNDSEYKVRMSC